jgi:hypothetical protein
MNTYVILLRRMEGRTKPTSLSRPVLSEIAVGDGVQLLDVFLTVGGSFDAVVLCRAPAHEAIGHLLDDLAGWHTEMLLATGHIRFESL